MNICIKDIQYKHKHQVSHNITFKQFQHENLYLGPSPQETLMPGADLRSTKGNKADPNPLRRKITLYI